MFRALLRLGVLLAGLLLLVAPRRAEAHARSTSWSAWTVNGGDVEVQVRLSRLDLSAVPAFTAYAGDRAAGAGDDGALAAYLEGHLRAETAAGPCEVERSSYAVLDARAAGEGFLVRSWRARCQGAGLRIVADLLFEEAPSHVHFASLTRDGTSVAERVLTHDARVWDLGDLAPATEIPSAGLGAFVALGIRHVGSGADHLVFVLALLVAATSLRTLAAVSYTHLTLPTNREV